MTEEQYRKELDREATQRQRDKKPWPAPAHARRVKIEDGPHMQRKLARRQMAEAANANREREGVTEHE